MDAPKNPSLGSKARVSQEASFKIAIQVMKDFTAANRVESLAELITWVFSSTGYRLTESAAAKLAQDAGLDFYKKLLRDSGQEGSFDTQEAVGRMQKVVLRALQEHETALAHRLATEVNGLRDELQRQAQQLNQLLQQVVALMTARQRAGPAGEPHSLREVLREPLPHAGGRQQVRPRAQGGDRLDAEAAAEPIENG